MQVDVRLSLDADGELETAVVQSCGEIIRVCRMYGGATVEWQRAIVHVLLEHFPTAQAVYLFGTYGTGFETPSSDIDIALLLPAEDAVCIKPSAVSRARRSLERTFGRDVDLINLRRVFPALQTQIVNAQRCLFCADERAADEFEGSVLARPEEPNREWTGPAAEHPRAGGRRYEERTR